MFGFGVMTGTSADGVDVSLLSFPGEIDEEAGIFSGGWSFPFPDGVREKILEMQENPAPSKESLLRFSVEYGFLVGECVRTVLEKLAPGRVRREESFVAMHGQTIGHYPGAWEREGSPMTLTFQSGSPQAVSFVTGLTVVSDFRAMDVVSGGRGAPLAPLYHRTLLRREKGVTAFLNVGGIANVTVVEKGEVLLATDTGPGNMLIDGAVRILSGGEEFFDRDGRRAASGTFSPQLQMFIEKRDPLLSRGLPATAGREDYGERFLREIMDESRRLKLSGEDLLCTLTRYTARCVRKALERGGLSPAKVYVGGGGAWNETLMRFLRKELSPAEVTTSEALGIPPQFVESSAFSFLGARALAGIPSRMERVTGGGTVILGTITPGENFVPLMERVRARRRFGGE